MSEYKRLTDSQVASGYEKNPGAPSAKSLRADHLQAREDVKRLAQMLQNFAGTAEAAVARTGMQVPFHGDFAHVPPSAIGRLRWWAREMRALLAEVDPK